MNVPILMKLLNELTPYSRQKGFWKRLEELILRYVDWPVWDPSFVGACKLIEFEPEVQRLVELRLGVI